MPFAELDATVEKTADKLLALPHLALEKIKAGLNQNLYSALADALEFEAVNQDECFHSADFIEGITAFMQKRKAIFNQDYPTCEILKTKDFHPQMDTDEHR